MCVDVGTKSIEGYFVRIARSPRVDLPRAWAAAPAPVEWMTVRAASGDIERTTEGPAAVGTAAQGPVAAATHAPAHAGANGFARASTPERAADADGAENATAVNGWFEAAPGVLHDVRRRTEWLGDVERTSWQAGPFAHSVTPPAYEVTEQRSGETRTVATPQGRIVLEQPWSVTIRGIGAHLSRRVIGRWEIVRARPASTEAESVHVDIGPETEVTLGGSESLVVRGASEARLGPGSEVRLGGASEEFLVGASELRFGGASERLLAGASESRWAGASERTWQGASELLYAGASERVVRGGSEERLAGGAPGWQAGGASELRIGASEQLLGGASERHLGQGASERSARASWQAFAAAGSRLAAPRVEPQRAGDAPSPAPAKNGAGPASS